MEHPIMFDDDAPALAELRRICLSFPDASERVSHGRPWFFTTSGFAIFGGGSRGPTREMFDSSVIVKVEPGHREALLHDARFFDPAYLGPSGWVGLDFDASPVDWQEVAELVDESYRLTAPKRSIATLDDAGGPAD